MTPTQTMVCAILTAIFTSSVWPVFGPRIIEWKNRKKTDSVRQEQARVDQRERERDDWMRDSEKAYQRAQAECKSCQKEIERLKREEIEPLKRDNAAMKEALLDRIEAFDEILPYLTNLPDEAVHNLRSRNRAIRTAVFKGQI